MILSNYKIFLSILFLYLLFDYIWIGVINKNYFTNKLKNINGTNMPNNVRLFSIIPLYLLMTLAFYYFIYKNMANKSHRQIYIEVFLLAITIFGVFDFTMYNMVSEWKFNDVVMDISYGSIMNLLIAYIILNYIK